MFVHVSVGMQVSVKGRRSSESSWLMPTNSHLSAGVRLRCTLFMQQQLSTISPQPSWVAMLGSMVTTWTNPKSKVTRAKCVRKANGAQDEQSAAANRFNNSLVVQMVV